MAMTENGELAEYRIFQKQKGLAGNIYAARITENCKAYRAAFADIGLRKNGFISDADLRPGSMVIVQAVSDERDEKGVRLKLNPELAGTYCVLLPGQSGIGISKKIGLPPQRERLQLIGDDILRCIAEKEGTSSACYGIVLRTDSADAPAAEIINDAMAQYVIWREIRNHFAEVQRSAAPCLLYSDDFACKMIKTYPLSTYTGIITDDSIYAAKLRQHMPAAASLISCLPAKGAADLFAVKSLDSKIEKLFMRKVWLKSGAHIVIEHTEAMTVIDVNSGRYTSARSPEETAITVNREAAREIMRQLRLRNLGGIIVCDFIDMPKSADRALLIEDMRGLAKEDPGHPFIAGITTLGLMEIARRRT